MRLIDADALGELVSHGVVHYEDIMAQPTVDAVEVIRCEDCKYYFREGHVRCWNIRGMHYPVEPYEFCSRAERKEE